MFVQESCKIERFKMLIGFDGIDINEKNNVIQLLCYILFYFIYFSLSLSLLNILIIF